MKDPTVSALLDQALAALDDFGTSPATRVLRARSLLRAAITLRKINRRVRLHGEGLPDHPEHRHGHEALNRD